MNKILVIAAHPDDEILGCGGTMAKATEAGNDVKVIIVAQGLASRTDGSSDKELKAKFDDLYESARNANRAVGVESVEFLGLPDNKMDSMALLDVVKLIEEKISEFEPNVIYTHYPNDLNIDHRMVAQAVITATRPMPGQSVKKLFFFEVPSSTDWNFHGDNAQSFQPNVFVNIELEIAKKIKSLVCYKGEMREFPHSRSIENLKNIAFVRGATVGIKAAEAFMLAREITD